ncbi:MAG: Tol-Pal system protein TolB [Chlamydiales bacterium]
MYKSLFFLLLLTLSVYSDEEIIVHLSNQARLSSLYVHPIEDIQSGFDVDYLKALEKVLKFDLNHNGKSELIQNSNDCEKQANHEKGLWKFEQEKWQKLGCDYVVKFAISNHQITTTFFSVRNNSTKAIDPLKLNGQLKDDRRVLHSIADAIQETCFGEQGICQTHILYTIRTQVGPTSSNWITEVWESDYDGANAHQITHHNGLCVNPTYIPAKIGEKCLNLLYVSYEKGQPKIYMTSSNRDEPKRLTYMRGSQLMPVISRQIDQIAFVSDITGNPDLFVQDFSPKKGLMGKPKQVFSTPQGVQGTPTFSPDGKQLAFVSNKDGTPRIYVITIPKAGASVREIRSQLISKKNRGNTAPAWSPDGTKIAYSATVSGVRQIYIYDFITEQETSLTNGYGHKENPAWAPDSLHLIFNSSTEESSELFLINLNQKKAVKITSGPGEKRFPAWEPNTMRRV